MGMPTKRRSDSSGRFSTVMSIYDATTSRWCWCAACTDPRGVRTLDGWVHGRHDHCHDLSPCSPDDADARASPGAGPDQSWRSDARARAGARSAGPSRWRRKMSNDPVTDQVPDTDAVAPEPWVEPNDETTLTAVLASYESAGFDAQLAATDEGQVHCYSCGS